MLRPSRPMILPFISSPGRCSTETTDSLVCSLAIRWMARVTILRARLSPSLRALPSMSLTVTAASRLAWLSMPAISSALACSAVSPAARSSTSTALLAEPVQVAALAGRDRCAAGRGRRICPRACGPLRRAGARVRPAGPRGVPGRCAGPASSVLTERISSSAARRVRSACSAAASALLTIPAASDSARARICSASSLLTACRSAWPEVSATDGWRPDPVTGVRSVALRSVRSTMPSTSRMATRRIPNSVTATVPLTARPPCSAAPVVRCSTQRYALARGVMRARRHCQTPKPGRQRCRRPGPPPC